MAEIEVNAEEVTSEDAQRLLTALEQELAALYENEGEDNVDPKTVQGKSADFLVARQDGKAVGCGALLPLSEGIAELRKLFVTESNRRQGVAKALLHNLEQRARSFGYKAIWLETGRYQPESNILFMTSGYEPTACFGKHLDNPLSVCFKKHL